jgi:two-component system, NarL family, response regulator NreC
MVIVHFLMIKKNKQLNFRYNCATMNKIRLAIADDNPRLHRVVELMIKTEKDFELALHAQDGIDLLEKLKTVKPDIILMDIRMPAMDGFEATNQVLQLYPEIKIIAFSQYDFEENIVDMYLLGVKSFIGKEDPPDELFKAIRTVHGGGAYMTDLSIKIVQKHLSNISKHAQNYFDSSAITQLSNTELKVLWYTSQHKSAKEIAEELFISHHTVNNHHSNMRHKLNINGRNSLLRYALAAKSYLTMAADGRVEFKK